MAFVFEQDRGLNNYNYDSSHMGPGKYYKDEISKPTSSYAPFLSTGNRSGFNKKLRQLTPGVGQYQISKSFIQEPVQTIAHDQTIILKIQPQETGIFKSNTKRFDNSQTDIPGPGTYDQNKGERVNIANLIRQQQIRNSSAPQSPDKIEIIDGLRNLNNKRKIPSIPNKIIKVVHDPKSEITDYKKYYEELHANQIHGIGPGNYQIKDIFQLNKNKGSVWSKLKGKRFKEEENVNSKNLGPGKYKLNKQSIPKYKLNRSSGFASDSVRTYFDNLYFKTNQQMKAELRKQTGFKDESQPGPGKYDVENAKKAIKLQTKPLVHQYFGSSQERFQDQENLRGYNICPGQYKLRSDFDKNNKAPLLNELSNQQPNIPFLSGAGREKLSFIDKDNEIPGPGSYDVNEALSLNDNILKKKITGMQGKFGTTANRFNNLDPTKGIPGPGQYQQNEEKDTKTCDNSFFKSTQQRDCFLQNKGNQPAVGEYYTEQQSIQYKIQKQKQFIDNLKKIDVTRPGFESSKPRFPHYGNNLSSVAEEKNGTADKPNLSISYQPQDNLYSNSGSSKINTRKRIKSQDNPKAPFLTNTKKMDCIIKTPAPGPCKYNPVLSEWSKRSFNIKYQPS